MKRLILFLLILSLYPVSTVFSEGRGGGGGGFSGGGSTGGGESRGGGGESGGGSNFSSDNNVHDSSSYSGERGSYSGNVRSNNLGARNLGSSYWGSQRQFSLGGRQNNFNRGTGYSFSRQNSSMNSGRLNVGGNPGRYVASSVVPSRLSSLGVRTMPHSVLNTQMPDVTSRSPRLAYPTTGANGAALRASAVTPRSNSSFVQSHMSTFAGSRVFMGQVHGFNRTENGAGHFYWHNWNGSNYCHYCDFNGCNWYGCYAGGFCFWSCYYGDNWWWYDGGYGRWCYWDNDNWWWQNPYDVNQTYMYDNGDYVSADNSQASTPTGVTTNNLSQGVYDSKDGTRQVKVTGDKQDAFLFDKSNPPAFQPVYLSSGVKEVHFSNPTNGQPPRIMVVLADGSFALFDDSGQPVQ
jgi:hypothetical protein